LRLDLAPGSAMAVELTIRGLSGNVVATLTAERAQTVSHVKQALQASYNIAASMQSLVLDMDVLSDSDPLDRVLAPEDNNAELTLVLVDPWLEGVSKDWKCLRKAPPATRNNRLVVLEAIERSKGEAIKFAGEEIRADRDVILAAMRHSPELYLHAKGDLGLDREFACATMRYLASPKVAARAQRTGTVLQRAIVWSWVCSEELCADREFLMLALAARGTALTHACEELRNDSELVWVAVHQDACAYQYASLALREDRLLTSQALRSKGSMLAHAPPHFQADRELVLLALQTSGDAFRYASEELRADRELVLLALQRDGTMLQFASTDLRNDPELSKAAFFSLRLQGRQARRP